MIEPESLQAARLSSASKAVTRFTTGLRRVHMYLGLLMMPWVLLFGVTAFSFNHPGTFRDLKGQSVSAEKVRAFTGYAPWDAEAAALELKRVLRERGADIEIVPNSARFSGWPLFVSPSTKGKEVLILRLSDGSAILATRIEVEPPPSPPFASDALALPTYDTHKLAEQLSVLQEKMGIDTQGPLRPHPSIEPELRLQAEDEAGRSWNLIYHLGSGKLEGRPMEGTRKGPMIEVLEALHTQHHYPPSFGPTFVWAAFSDLTALIVIFWALSGLLMWIQMRKFRALGLVVVSVGLVIATAVMVTTSDELTFGPTLGEE